MTRSDMILAVKKCDEIQMPNEVRDLIRTLHDKIESVYMIIVALEKNEKMQELADFFRKSIEH